LQILFQIAAIDAHDGDVDVRRLALQALDELRQEGQLVDLAHRDRERARAGARIEASGALQELFEPAERTGDVGGDRARERRRHHVVAPPLEQRVVEQLAQPGERVAHGRLRQVQALAGRRDPAVAVDRVENREQVQVDPGKLHWRAPCRTLGAKYAQGRCGAMQPLHWRSRVPHAL
jgi:hypothetical protein